MLALIARQPDPDTLARNTWQDLPAEQRTIIMVRARNLLEWLTAALNSGDTSGEVQGLFPPALHSPTASMHCGGLLPAEPAPVRQTRSLSPTAWRLSRSNGARK